jgi:hypothetical protein
LKDVSNLLLLFCCNKKQSARKGSELGIKPVRDRSQLEKSHFYAVCHASERSSSFRGTAILSSENPSVSTWREKKKGKEEMELELSHN